MNEALVTASYLKRKFPNDPKMREVIDFIESSRSKGFMHGIISGGIVTWITGLTFLVSETVYYVMNLLCETGGLVTLSPADPDLPRIDLIVINSDWEVEVIEGIPAENPLQPTPDPQTQLALTYVLIPAAATEPANITEIIVFNEHVAGEFTPSASGVVVDFDNATSPYMGLKCASVGSIGNNDTITLTSDAPKLKADYESLSLFLKLKAAASKSHALYAQFRLAGVVVSNEVALQFNLTDTTNWQNIGVLLSAFTFSNAQFDAIRLRWSKTGTQTNFTGFYLDYVKLQKGIVQPTFVDTVELTGDITGKGKTGTPFATTLKTVNSNVGTFGSETKVPQITVDAKGRVLGIVEKTIPEISTEQITTIVNTVNKSNHESYLIENTANVSETVLSSWTVIPYTEQLGEFKAVVMVRNKALNTIITLMNILSFDYSDAVKIVQQNPMLTDANITLTVGVDAGTSKLYATVAGMTTDNKRIHLCFERCVLSERTFDMEASMELTLEMAATITAYLNVSAISELQLDMQIVVSTYHNASIAPELQLEMFAVASFYRNLEALSNMNLEMTAGVSLVDSISLVDFAVFYNLEAVNDARELAPTGWRVAAIADWMDLITFLGGESLAGGEIKKLETWTAPNSGATANSLFKALPAGQRNELGEYSGKLTKAIFWIK